MQYRRQSSFDRTYRKLSAPEQAALEQALGRLVRVLDSGEKTEGLGLSVRVFFKMEKGRVTFVIVGIYDAMRRYLRHA